MFKLFPIFKINCDFNGCYDFFYTIFSILTHGEEGEGNLSKKVPGKKVSGKKPGNKTLEKSPNFLKSFEKVSLEIKSCVLDSWNFFTRDFFIVKF